MEALQLLLGVLLTFGQPPSTTTPNVGLLVDEEVFRGTVTHIVAADRIEVQRGLDTLQVRLRGVRALPGEHPLHGAAIDLLSRMLRQRSVEVRSVLDPDSSEPNHLLGRVLRGGTDPARTLLERGLALYCRSPGGDVDLKAAEEKARTEREGVWADDSSASELGRATVRCG